MKQSDTYIQGYIRENDGSWYDVCLSARDSRTTRNLESAKSYQSLDPCNQLHDMMYLIGGGSRAESYKNMKNWRFRGETLEQMHDIPFQE